MTRAVRNRILKDLNGDINDHLRNHVHLTNCIHFKNHMHKHSPILSDRFLMRDLIAVQRSRSLRDPSASSRSWHSPSVFDLLAKSVDRDVVVQEGRRSVGIERPRHQRRLSGSSPPFAVLPEAKAGPKEVYGANDTGTVVATSEQTSKSKRQDSRRIRQEEFVQRSARNSLLGGNKEYLLDYNGNESLHDIHSRKYDSREISHMKKGKQVHGPRLKTLSERLDDIQLDSDDLASSIAHPLGRVTRGEKSGREVEAAVRVGGSVPNKGRRRKFRRSRRTRPAVDSGDTAIQNEMSIASNFMGQEAAEEQGQRNVKKVPSNGCGIPWNWSRIHDRGKTFFDMAGMSLSCGVSEEKGGAAPHRRKDASDVPMASYNSNSSSNPDAEGLPLLVGSQDSTENAGRGQDYSGELGMFADHLLNKHLESDLASEARSGNRLRGQHCRHRSLTQKYAPQAFQDLVGLNLVAQALSNAVFRRRIGFLYVFYGPHGTGKTSCARIFARAVNCQSLDHQKPCGYCSACVAHDVGKSQNIREVGPVNNLDFESIMDLLDSMTASRLPSAYRVLIFDDCDTLSAENWSAISKVMDRAPRRVVIILLCSRLEVLPHVIISRCQKFFYPKLKDADIIFTLQWVSAKEGLHIDVDALKLIASRSDGSLRDALMTLEQLSLLGQRISVMLVQELVGLVSDEKLVDLLDLALSADTVNTIKNLREIMENGVEPLALMSQLAAVITDILAGSYEVTKERHPWKFFRRQPLVQDDMERLRHALKTLSEADRQLRMSNDKLTWLTAALLQLAPDQQYLLSNSSADATLHQTPALVNNAGNREPAPASGSRVEMPDNRRRMLITNSSRNADFQSTRNRVGIRQTGEDAKGQRRYSDPHHSEVGLVSRRRCQGRTYKDIQDIWLDVLEQVDSSNVKEFLYQEGRLTSVSFGAAPTVQLMFSSHLTKHKAEKFRWQILHAFESAFGMAVTIEIRCQPHKDAAVAVDAPLTLPAPRDSSSQNRDAGSRSHQFVSSDVGIRGDEIVEVEDSPREVKGKKNVDGSGKVMDSNAQLPPSFPERIAAASKNRSQSIVREKASLGHMIQQAEGCSQHGGWSRRKAVSIAEKLEQENLRLEPRSRNLLCWKVSRGTRPRLSRFKIRSRKPCSLLKLVSCERCLSGKSSSR